MGKIIFYVAASLDGYIADEQGGIDWLMPFQEAGYDYGYPSFYEKIGQIITGSKTFEQASNFPGGWNFPHSTTYIFSSRQLDLGGRSDLKIWNKGIVPLANQLKKETTDSWMLGGAHLAGQFFNEKEIDEVILSVMPVVLGKGRPLFEGIKGLLQFDLINQSSFPNGVVQLHYRLKLKN